MKNPETVYVLLEDKINKILKKVISAMEFGNHEKKPLIVFNELKDEVEKTKDFLIKTPSVQAVSLAGHINTFYKKDPSMQSMLIHINLVENPDKKRTGSITLNMY